MRLVPYGYPGSRIARFIEDDPARPMRAVGTSVDPNSLWRVADGRIRPRGGAVRRSAAVNAGLVGAVCCVAFAPALALTYSRGAWLGALAGRVVVVACCRAWLADSSDAGWGGARLRWVLAAGLWSGCGWGSRCRIPATKLRLAEYDNAWRSSNEHPWFGVGFGDARFDRASGGSVQHLSDDRRARWAGRIATSSWSRSSSIVWRGLACLECVVENGERSDHGTVLDGGAGCRADCRAGRSLLLQPASSRIWRRCSGCSRESIVATCNAS